MRTYYLFSIVCLMLYDDDCEVWQNTYRYTLLVNSYLCMCEYFHTFVIGRKVYLNTIIENHLTGIGKGKL